MAIETLNSTDLTPQTNGDAEHLKFKPGEVMRNVMIVDVNEGESTYGLFTTVMFENMDGDKYSLLVSDTSTFGRNVIKKFTVGPEGSRMINPKLEGHVIWLGRSEEIQSKKIADKKYTELVWNFEE